MILHFQALSHTREKRQLNSSCLSVRLYVCMFICPRVLARFSLDGFSRNLILKNVIKSVEKIQTYLKSDKNVRHFTRRPN
jgi:hypothetical protein